jgi:hypothetical protein
LPLIQWLVLAALADWLIARTLTRMAIFMPKSPAMVVVYQAVGLAGQLATTLAGLLGLVVLGWIAWREWRAGHVWLSPLWLGLASFGLVFLVVPPSGWLAITNHAFGLAAAGIITYQTLRFSPARWREPGRAKTLRVSGAIAILLPAAAFLAGRLDQAMAAWYAAMQWSGPPPLAGVLFHVGELCVVLGAFGLWWAYGRGASWRMGLGAALPALAFAGMYLAMPSMTGILAIWSTGLTLYLPWPMYGASLWLAGLTVLVSLRRRDLVAWAILLLAAAGYSPQSSTQVFLSLIALWLLASRRMEAPAQYLSTCRSPLGAPGGQVLILIGHRNRKAHHKGAPFVQLTLNRDAPAMCFDDVSGDGQPQTQSF